MSGFAHRAAVHSACRNESIAGTLGLRDASGFAMCDVRLARTGDDGLIVAVLLSSR